MKTPGSQVYFPVVEEEIWKEMERKRKRDQTCTQRRIVTGHVSTETVWHIGLGGMTKVERKSVKRREKCGQVRVSRKFEGRGKNNARK